MNPKLNQRYKVTTCGYCHTDFFYTDKDQLCKHKTCMSKPKPIQRQFTMTEEEQAQMIAPYVKRRFAPVQLRVVQLEGYTEQESHSIIHKAFILQKLKYLANLDALESMACIENDTTMWILGPRFSFTEVMDALSHEQNSLLVFI